MKKDFKDTIINTARGYDDYGRRNARPVKDTWFFGDDFEDEISIYEKPRKESRTKVFNDRLAPMYRWLDKQIGRKFDDVWSDICKFNDIRCVRGRHLREHAWSELTYSLRLPFRFGSFGYNTFYVDDNGILCKTPKYVKRKKPWPNALT